MQGLADGPKMEGPTDEGNHYRPLEVNSETIFQIAAKKAETNI